MTRTAILTITCPWCGGRVEGVTSTDQPQRIPCPYCRTDLHVPRVGDRVVERRVIERVIEVPVHKRRGHPVAGAIVAAIGMIAMFVVAGPCSSSKLESMTRKHDQEQRQRNSCKGSCGPSCPEGKTVEELLDQDYDGSAWDRALARSRCVMDCELACLGIERRRP